MSRNRRCVSSSRHRRSARRARDACVTFGLGRAPPRIGRTIVIFACRIAVYGRLRKPRPAALARGTQRAGSFLSAAAAEPCCYTSTQTGRQYDDDPARPDVSRIAEACHGSSAGELRLHLAAQPGFFKARRACRDRRQAGLVDLQPGRSHRDDAEQGRRVSPFRLERLLVVAVAARRPRLPRAALSHHSRHAVLPHLHRRYQAGSDARRRSTRSSSPRRSSRRPDTRGPTRSIAGRKAFTSRRSAAAARTAPMDRPASSSWIARPSRCSDDGRSIAVRRH